MTFQTYNAEGTEIRARVSKGGEEVNTLSGVVTAEKGAVVIERVDQAGVYDVLSADAFNGLGYSKGNAKPVDEGEAADTTSVQTPPATNPGTAQKSDNPNVSTNSATSQGGTNTKGR
jgi:hypothetical protein